MPTHAYPRPFTTPGHLRSSQALLWPVLARWVMAALATLLCIACTRSGTSAGEPAIEAAPPVSSNGAAAARTFYAARCAECHGPSGGGDGPRAPTLRPRPQRLSDRIWQSNVSNARLKRALLAGGPGVGKSDVMPAFPELAQQPETLAGLVAQLRSFATPQNNAR